MTLEKLTLEILGERALGFFDSKKLVHWAEKVLELGYESENLYILAGLDYDTTEEREDYFWRSVKDLKLDVEKSHDELILTYALLIAYKAIKGEISVDYAFSQMKKIVSATSYDPRYIAFYEIDEDLHALYFRNSVIFNYGLTLENYEEFILEELKIFVQMEELKIPEDEQRSFYCEKCKSLNKPKLKTKYQLKKPFKFQVWTCGLCGSEKLKFDNNHELKWMIIEAFKKKNLTNNFKPT